MSQQSHILPDCDWQHITFTMPHLLWPFFNNNWPLLNALFRAATRAMLRWARKQGLKAFLHTDPYKCILCGNRLRFTGAQAGRHASELMAERLHNIDRKRWLLSQTAG
nr:hypothetical protein [Klebsiella aerogenes]